MALHRKRVTYSERSSFSARAAHARGERRFRTYDTSAIQPKRGKGPLIFGIILALIVLGGVGCFLHSHHPFDGSDSQFTAVEQGTQVSVTIPEGSSVKQIAEILGKSGLISNSREFTDAVKRKGAESNLKPGAYRIVAGTDVEDIVDILKAGPEAQGVTIPEGFTLEQIATAVSDATSGRISADEFLKAAGNAKSYESEFPFVSGAYNNSLEGFLFPKTYEVTDADTADSMVRKMLAQYQTETAALDYSLASGEKGLTRYQVLIMASLIEREAAKDNRATVASVFYNRLAADMKLQSDATVAYVVKKDPKPEDLEIDSPYNTYLVDGLPAGPICSPSLDSLKAACAPESTDYLYFYFTAGSDGKMVYSFSKDYDEHQKAIGEDTEK